MNNNITKLKWEELHTENRFRPKYPCELIVQFIFRNFKRDNTEKILDVGSGAGRHIVFMAKEGINAYGIDISKNGIEYTRENINKLKLNANLKVSSMDKIPYEDNFFDGLISYASLYYCKYDDIKKTVSEMYRVLKKGGIGLIFIRDIEDYRFGQGNEIEKNTFVISESNNKKCAFNENNMTMHFFDYNEVNELFNIFSHVTIDKVTETHNNQEFKDSNYIIKVIK